MFVEAVILSQQNSFLSGMPRRIQAVCGVTRDKANLRQSLSEWWPEQCLAYNEARCFLCLTSMANHV